jgi:hypothetical protein
MRGLSEYLGHGLIEGHAENLDKEVDGIAGLVLAGPSPVGVFDKESLVGGQFEVLGFARDQFEAALAQERFERRHAG